MAEVKRLSQASMVPLVREILHGKDLSKVTARTVREEVIARLGTDTTDDMPALKASVKSALDVVLTSALHEEQERGSEEPPVPKKGRAHTSEDDGNDADVERDSGAANGDLSESDGEESGDAESEEDLEPGLPSKRGKGSGERKSSPPQKRARVSGRRDTQFSSKADFDRLKRICRQIGCPVPPARQKGHDMREKCANVLAYLRSKGVTDADPTRMRKEEISIHRKRIEREKDLEGLDVSNIIEDEGRPRRRRSAVPISKNDDLPSDLSGPELSEKSEDEGEEFAISDAESS